MLTYSFESSNFLVLCILGGIIGDEFHSRGVAVRYIEDIKQPSIYYLVYV